MQEFKKGQLHCVHIFSNYNFQQLLIIYEIMLLSDHTHAQQYRSQCMASVLINLYN